MNSKNKFALAISGIVAVVIFWIYWVSVNPGENPTMIQFLSVEELADMESSPRIKLGGNVKTGSIAIAEADLLDMTFILQQGTATVPVHYYGARPDLFKDEAEVIIEGNLSDGIFQADLLQTKCASRYEGDLRNEENYNLEEL